MFVLPPPPKFPVGSPAYTAALMQMRDNNIDTHNTLKFPTGEEYMLTTGEGVYTLREDIHLAVPPPHPSEIPIMNPNPLSTLPIQVTAGVKLSLCTLTRRQDSLSNSMYRIGTNNIVYTETRSSIDANDYDDNRSEHGSLGGASRMSDTKSMPPISSSLSTSFGAIPETGYDEKITSLQTVITNASVPSAGRDPAKRRKPKSNLTKSNSTFVSRVNPHEHLAKRLQEHKPNDLYFFANLNRSFNWMDYGSETYKHEPLSKILFTSAHPISHDVNALTRGPQHIDVIIGFSTADIVWYEATSGKYNRLNKSGCINPKAAPAIRWVPGSENLCMAAHLDGSIVIYDKEKEDSNFDVELKNGSIPDSGKQESKDVFQIIKSIHVNQRGIKQNPVAVWKVARKGITAFTFSPDSRYIAVVSEDGYLKIIDFLREKLVDVFSGYYGGLLCVCWSPDGRYILTGGEDDLVSIWSVGTKSLVARCQGHQSFVRDVAFDPWKCDERVYRFGSVGDDCRLLLWDFNVRSLHRPRGTTHRGSTSSGAGSFSKNTIDRQSIISGRDRSDSNAVVGDDEESYHTAASKASIPILPPVMSKRVDPEPLTSLYFREDMIIVTCHDGHIRTWNRPHVHSTNGVVDKS
ncbi:WD40-repeat-containing domain protein [Lipomyces arxii]|uniref:WD40-repeat-containing domain protein n=1 Tax=Lipomyces arxii TaxID=56418 RepID=UPI0034CF8CE4